MRLLRIASPLLAPLAVAACNLALPLGDLNSRTCPPGQTACGNKCVVLDAGEACAGAPLPIAALVSDSSANHTCALGQTGEVRCWGSNDSGQIGDGTPCAQTPCDPRPSAVRVVGIADPVASVAVGQAHTCAATKGGSVFCWGSNTLGQLGLGQPDTVAHSTPTPVPGLAGVASVVAGAGSTCALKKDGTVLCWGDNSYGQLGVPLVQGGNNEKPSPVPVTTLSSITAIAAGGRRLCALKVVGNVATASCVGQNEFGELGVPLSATAEACPGTGTTQCTASFQPFGSFTDVTAMSCGSRHTCALRKDGSVWCSGRAADGELGTGALNGSPQFAPVAADLGAGTLSLTSFAAGGSHSCGVVNGSNLLACWGLNTKGCVFAPTTSQAFAKPTVVPSAGTVSFVATGSGHTCVVATGGGASCVGSNDKGQLGRGTTKDAVFDTPQPVQGL